MVKNCNKCASTSNESPKIYHPWEYPEQPWQRVHVDYLGPFCNVYILVIVDAHTKWVEAYPTHDITSATTIRLLQETFSRFGLPITIVSDNGSQFRSFELNQFLKNNGINHKYTASYHPATNGQAERYVQTIKRRIKAALDEPDDIHLKLCRLLMQYRKLPNSTTGISPAELMFRRPIRTKIDLLRRDVVVRQKEDNRFPREFAPGDLVQVRCYTNSSVKWKIGVVTARKGNLHYDVLIDGIRHNYHVDQMKATLVEEKTPEPIVPLQPIQDEKIEKNATVKNSVEEINYEEVQTEDTPTEEEYVQENSRVEEPNVTEEILQENPPRRSGRIRRAPSSLNL